MSISIAADGSRSESPDNSPIIKKIKEIVSDLKTRNITPKARLEESIGKLNTVVLKEATKQRVVKTTNAGYVFIQSIFFFLTVWLGYVYFSRIHSLTTSLATLINNSYFGYVTLGYISMALSILIVVNLLLLFFPFSEQETKSKVIGVESKILIILIFGMVIFNVLGLSSFFLNYTTTEQGEVITENINKTTVSLWDRIGCYVTFNQQCITDKLTTQTAIDTQRSSYSLSFEKPLQITKTLEQWKTRPINLQYKIASSGDLRIDKIVCYQEKIDDKHKLDEKEINKVINTDGQSTIIPEIECDLSKLTVSGKTQTEDITIIPVLYMTLDTSYTIKIPIISQEKYIEETSEIAPISYLDYKTIEYMNKNNKKFEIVQSNNALIFSAKGSANMFPLVYGNEESLKFDLPIEISENSQNPLGKIEKIELAQDLEISQYFIYEKTDNENLFSNSTDGTKKYMDFYLTEDESQSSSIDLPIIISNIDLKLRSTLKKEDMGTRFKITVRDIQISSQNSTSSITSTNNLNNLSSNSLNQNTNTNQYVLMLGDADENGIYTYGADLLATNLYYKNTGVWLWSPDEVNWMSLSQESVSGGEYDGQIPSDGNLEFIRNLRQEVNS